MTDPRIGVVGIPGKWSTETLADAVEERTSRRLVVDMSKVRADLASGSLWLGDVDLCELDGLIVKKIGEQYSPHVLDQIELLRVAEASGVRVFSKPASMLRMIDRLSCTIALSSAGIPMPETTVTESDSEAVKTILRYGQAILKPLFSTKARGMEFVDSSSGHEQLTSTVRGFQSANRMLYVQQKVELPGQDLGMVFLGGQYLGSYARVGGRETWNTTIHAGGRYASSDPPAATVELATRAQAIFDMDFTTVDVAETSRGPVVFEVSAFGGFRGAKEGIGIDAAKLYVDYVLGELAK